MDSLHYTAFLGKLGDASSRFQAEHPRIVEPEAVEDVLDGSDWAGSQSGEQKEINLDDLAAGLQGVETKEIQAEEVMLPEEVLEKIQAHYGPNSASEPKTAGETHNNPFAFEREVYEWNEEDGEIAPPNEDLERILFRETTLTAAGSHLQHLTEFDVKVHGKGYEVKTLTHFDDGTLHPVLRESISLCRYDNPTPVQIYAIPAILKGLDVFASAQAGSGKTGAYLIPIISTICGKYSKMAAPRPGLGLPSDATLTTAEPLVIILSPTRELAIQIFDHARRLCYRTKIRPCVVYGGGGVKDQRIQLQKGCDILVGTLGRMCDFIRRGDISTERARFIVLDEADELVSGDWDEELRPILGGPAPIKRQIIMFSATFDIQARLAASRLLNQNHVRISVGRVGSSHKNVHQNIMWVDEDKKIKALLDLLMSLPPCRVMVFCNTIQTVEAVDDEMYMYKLPVTSIHRLRTQKEHVTARGIDVQNVMHVINFDLPSMDQGGLDEYVNRIGRTGRIGNQGAATSFYNDRNDGLGFELVKLLLECEQQLPDFLSNSVPDDVDHMFDDQKSDKAEEESNGIEAF